MPHNGISAEYMLVLVHVYYARARQGLLPPTFHANFDGLRGETS